VAVRPPATVGENTVMDATSHLETTLARATPDRSGVVAGDVRPPGRPTGSSPVAAAVLGIATAMRG
jgi:hypothetical protein